jgi:hypothetical protein
MSNNHFSFYEIINSLFTTTEEKASAVVAASMISTPLWRDKLHEISIFAGDLAAPLGCFWLIIQIIAKVIEMSRHSNMS